MFWLVRMASFTLNSIFATRPTTSHGPSSPCMGQPRMSSRPIFSVVNFAKDNPYPILIGGDFNLLRFPNEKSRGRFDNHWPFLFNAVIDSLDAREVSMIGRQFTWANSVPELTYEKLDRVLMDTD